MVVVICSICGDDWPVTAEHCPSCEARDMRAVPVEDLPPTPEERLLANVHRTLQAISALREGRIEQLAEAARERRERALRERLEGQMGVVEARLRHERDLRSAEAHREALARLKRELRASL